MATEFYIVQHGEKARTSGDPALSEAGVRQARLTGRYLRGRAVSRVISSPLRRASETARHIADELGLDVRLDDRPRERMNWGDASEPQTLEEFLAEWARATRDRDYEPGAGDSSRRAGERFESLLEELSGLHSGERVVIVSHGGVTADLLRNLFGDEHLRTLAPGLLDEGVPACAITRLRRGDGGYELAALASVAHLPDHVHTPHRPA